MAEGWCTLEDVRRALRKAGLPGDIDQDKRIAVDAIVAQTEPLEKRLSRYWYADGVGTVTRSWSQVRGTSGAASMTRTPSRRSVSRPAMRPA